MIYDFFIRRLAYPEYPWNILNSLNIVNNIAYKEIIWRCDSLWSEKEGLEIYRPFRVRNVAGQSFWFFFSRGVSFIFYFMYFLCFIRVGGILGLGGNEGSLDSNDEILSRISKRRMFYWLVKFCWRKLFFRNFWFVFAIKAQSLLKVSF